MHTGHVSLSENFKEMAQHVKLKHAFDEPFVYPNSSAEIECPD